MLQLNIISSINCLGPVIAGVIVFVIIRSVKYVILRKGGQDVTLVTYHPYKKEVVNTVPLDKVSRILDETLQKVEKNIKCMLKILQVSSLTSRDGLKAYIPIKIKGKKWNYLLDKNGHFVNPDLFDDTVGVKRFE